jgi:hypothetical protein
MPANTLMQKRVIRTPLPMPEFLKKGTMLMIKEKTIR